MSSKGNINTPTITHVGQNDLIKPTEHSPLEQAAASLREPSLAAGVDGDTVSEVCVVIA